ncbi:MAG: DUF58 domain-containing protein [Fibrobacteria bacterium]|nr:DUF58 domain-containing protein [Fibrobacteria bacterium]
MKLTPYLSNEYITQIKNFQLKTKIILKGALAGWHESPFHGYSSEFSQHRNYTPGDNLRYFDWKIYAKTERAVIKQYQDETNTNIYLVLDNSASMEYKGSTSLTKLEYASVLAASLATLSFRQRDAVSLSYGAVQPDFFMPPKNSAANLQQIFTILEGMKCSGTTDLEGLFAKLAPVLKSGSMSYIFTDLWQEPDSIITGIKKLRHKSQAISLVQILTPEETDFISGREMELVDMETFKKVKVSATGLKKLYRETLEEHQHYLHAECFKLKINLINITNGEPFFRSVRRLLSSHNG